MCLEQMKLENIPPDAASYVCSLKTFCNVGSVAKGRDIHHEIVKAGYENDPLIQNTLVDMYAKCGSLVDAREAFQKMPSRSVISWTALIAGHARCGDCEMAFHLFEEMVGDGVWPNDTTFLILLSVCSHAGLVEKGWMYFDAMERDYGIKPSLKHYNGMLDLLSRAGRLDEAMMMIESLPLLPNLVTWKTILSACSKWGNVGIARRAFEWAVKMNEKHSSIFMLMSNIYTDASMWKDLKKVKELQAHLGSRCENVQKDAVD
jgi:pentatricopeptide repeat protein